MNVRNCRECGKIFNYITGLPLCPACKENLENKFNEVKEFINNNKDATIKSVSEECDVSENQIRQWVREERLVFSNPSISGILCENCGTPILTGRFCDKCKLQTMNDINSLKRESQPKIIKPKRDTPRMRFLDNNKR